MKLVTKMTLSKNLYDMISHIDGVEIHIYDCILKLNAIVRVTATNEQQTMSGTGFFYGNLNFIILPQNMWPL